MIPNIKTVLIAATSVLIFNYLELYQKIWSKSVIFVSQRFLFPASQLNLFPRFCILGEFDIFGNIGFFDCFKPNWEFVFLFDGCLCAVGWLLLVSFGSFLVSIAGNFELSNGGWINYKLLNIIYSYFIRYKLYLLNLLSKILFFLVELILWNRIFIFNFEFFIFG